MTTNHPVWFVPVTGTEAKIGLTPCPGTQEAPLHESLSTLKDWGARAILTLMPEQEMADNQVSNLGKETEQLGMHWFHLPIADDEGPAAAFQAAWASAGPVVHQLLNEGNSIAIHCKGGSGRTGLVAAQIMLEQGMGLQESIRLIKAQRPGAFSAPAQQEYIQQVSER
ncbi:MAG: dual specificity protein phosphatase family protein [Endozoicomonas sp.]